MRLSGGRSWWAHFEFIPINITPMILPKKIEDVRHVGATAGGQVNRRGERAVGD
jgi:hypothetical protein